MKDILLEKLENIKTRKDELKSKYEFEIRVLEEQAKLLNEIIDAYDTKDVLVEDKTIEKITIETPTTTIY